VLLFEPNNPRENALQRWLLTNYNYLQLNFNNHELQLLRQEKETRLGLWEGVMILVRDLFEMDPPSAAPLEVCNWLGRHFDAPEVGLGWVQGRYVRLWALRNRHEFQKRSEAVAMWEAAMEECADAGQTVVLPDASAGRLRTRAQEQLAHRVQLEGLCAVPLWRGSQLIGVLLLARRAPWRPDEYEMLPVIGQQLTGPLEACAKAAAPWWRRLGQVAGEGTRRATSLQNAGFKLAGLLFVLALMAALLIPIPHRLEAPATLKTPTERVIAAPFNGYLNSLEVQAGQRIVKGQLLATLDTTEHRLKQAQLQAKLRHHEAEAVAARGEGKLAALEVARHKAAQIRSELNLLEQRIDRSRIRSPTNGLVADEAGLRERLGSSVDKGQALLKIIPAGSLLARLEIRHRDAARIRAGQHGEIAFDSRPGATFKIELERIEPTARATKEGPVVVALANLTDPPAPWVRPGLEGVAKVDIGEASLFAILSQPLVDWLRLRLWW
jgi:multidrug resistance efflux pump